MFMFGHATTKTHEVAAPSTRFQGGLFLRVAASAWPFPRMKARGDRRSRLEGAGKHSQSQHSHSVGDGRYSSGAVLS